jgi:probable F420-dependent oxidoreductase
MKRLRVGLQCSVENCSVEELRTVWMLADEGGVDHLWDADHLVALGDAHLKPFHTGSPEALNLPVFEGWALLAAMAGATKRVRIGCLVTGNTYRNPATLAKQAVTVDHLSNGRLEFGIGAAWFESEHAMFGFTGLDHRVGRLSESLQVIKSLWTDDRPSFHGRYYTLDAAIANPKPRQRPHPPIWIAGGAEQMIGIVARHADVWNAHPVARGELRNAVALSTSLDRRCTELGRDPSEVRRSVDLPWDGNDPDALIDDCGRWVEAGFDDIIVRISSSGAARTVDRFCASVLPLMRSLR